MDQLASLIGTAAAICTTASYIPQVRKAWATRSTGDLSLKMLLLLLAGLSLWCVYGLVRADIIIVAANGASVAMLLSILYVKLSGS